MINAIQTRGAGLQKNFKLTEEVKSVNWTTVLIADNGGRKSLVLRLLAEGALNRKIYKSRRGEPVLIEPFEQLPQKIIAISGTPLDRFPRTGTADLRGRNKSSIRDQFVYLGQRSANGMSGVAQSERSLVGSFIANRKMLSAYAEPIRKIFGQLNLMPKISVVLKPASISDRNVTQWIAKRLEAELMHAPSVRETSVDDGGEILHKRIRAILAAKRHHYFSSLISGLGLKRITLVLGPERCTRTANKVSMEDWEILLRIGAMEVASTFFEKKPTRGRPSEKVRSKKILGDDLSSGQWSWLATFAPLCCELRDNTLILVDEPENSLHPKWQQEFVPKLNEIIALHSNCQVVIATHSPLVASGVSPDCGNVRRIHKKYSRPDGVVSEEIPNTFGWKASDVYEQTFDVADTRAKSFTKIADQALGYLRDRRSPASNVRQNIISELNAQIGSLPEFDPMRQIFLSITKDLSALKGVGD